MKELDFKFWSRVRRFVFLVLFIVGIILIFNTTTSIVNNAGFDNLTGMSRSTDKRIAYLLVSLFGFVGYFVETILEIKYKDIKKEDIN
ncbi:MAG: hypothetical protein HUJ77_13355 [Clostridium sp.]|uniref:hypothetical protein n=1 Tax=Clostridium sp. TaxID=1506 RepID=UPI0025BC4DD4|nr:hypothetical protein [Clostridium sp.]MCF0149368.1 hypothetical protein [Clostridium sp.]